MVVALGGDEREHKVIAHGLIASESNLIVRNERAYLEKFAHAMPVAQIGGQITAVNGFQVLAPAGPATLAARWGSTLAGVVVVGSGTDAATLRLDDDTALGQSDALTVATDRSLLAMTQFSEIRNGSTLDLNGDRNLGTEFIKVAGDGVNNAGAIINTVYKHACPARKFVMKSNLTKSEITPT